MIVRCSCTVSNSLPDRLQITTGFMEEMALCYSHFFFFFGVAAYLSGITPMKMFLCFSVLGPWTLIKWSRKSHTKLYVCILCIFPSPEPLNTQVFPRKYCLRATDHTHFNKLLLVKRCFLPRLQTPQPLAGLPGLPFLLCYVCSRPYVPPGGRANAFWNILPNIFFLTLVFLSFYFGGGGWAAL